MCGYHYHFQSDLERNVQKIHIKVCTYLPVTKQSFSSIYTIQNFNISSHFHENEVEEVFPNVYNILLPSSTILMHGNIVYINKMFKK